MKFALISAVFSATVILALSAHAQETESQQDHGNQDAVLTAPDSLTSSNSQVVANVQESRDEIVGGARVSFYDDAAFFTGPRRSSDYQYSILPSIGLRLFQPDTQWHVDYAGGVTFDQKTLSRGLASHNFSGELLHSFTRRLQLRLREGYLVTSDPFVHLGQSQSLVLTSPGQVNSLVVNPQAQQVANASSGDLTYQFSRHSSLGFDGNFSALRFRHTGTASTSGLIDTRVTSGRMFYVHQVTASQKLGVEYQLQDLRFQRGQSRTLDQRVVLFDEITLRRGMTLSFFVGPDRSHSHSVVSLNPSIHAFTILRNRWSPAAGATYTWRGAHAGLRLSGQHSITDGGGLFGATLSNVVSLEIEKTLSPRWSLSLGGNYLSGHSIDGLVGGTGQLKTKQAQIRIARSITSQISVQALYQHIQQGQSTIPSQIGAGSRDQVECSLNYSFTRLLRQ